MIHFPTPQDILDEDAALAIAPAIERARKACRELDEALSDHDGWTHGKSLCDPFLGWFEDHVGDQIRCGVVKIT